jgi:vancomycin permeability regulator SanA
MQSPFTRALALAFSLFLLLNLVLRIVVPRLDGVRWLLDLRMLPGLAAAALLGGAGMLLAAYGIRPAMGGRRRAATLLMVGSLAAVAAINSVQVLSLAGRIDSLAPLSVSLLVAALLTSILIAVVRGPEPASRLRTLASLAVVIAGIAAFPLAQIILFGKTDYRRPADAVVVLGARVYADGRPSDALADRMRTACELVVSGYAPLLIVSGGPGDGPIHETESMRRLAIELGVPPHAILVDAHGVSTRATMDNLATIAAAADLQHILAVSHFYHLPRISLIAERCGLQVYTVPARESYTLSRLPWFIAREVVACWAYYLNPAVQR